MFVTDPIWIGDFLVAKAPMTSHYFPNWSLVISTHFRGYICAKVAGSLSATVQLWHKGNGTGLFNSCVIKDLEQLAKYYYTLLWKKV